MTAMFGREGRRENTAGEVAIQSQFATMFQKADFSSPDRRTLYIT